MHEIDLGYCVEANDTSKLWRCVAATLFGPAHSGAHGAGIFGKHGRDDVSAGNADMAGMPWQSCSAPCTRTAGRHLPAHTSLMLASSCRAQAGMLTVEQTNNVSAMHAAHQG